MDETIKNLKKITKKDLIRCICAISDYTKFDNINLMNYTKTELIDIIINNFIEGDELYVLFSSFTEFDLYDLYDSLVEMDGKKVNSDYDVSILESFHSFGLASKANHVYHVCDKVKEVINNVLEDSEHYRNKKRHWIACCIHYANNFYGVYPLSFLLNLVNQGEFSFDEKSLVEELEKIPYYAVTFMPNDYIEYDELSFVASEIDKNLAEEIKRYQDNVDIYVPDQEEIETYSVLDVIPTNALGKITDKLCAQLNSEFIGYKIMTTLFDINRLSTSYGQFYNEAIEVLKIHGIDNINDYEDLLKEIHSTSPSLAYQGGCLADLDIRDLFTKALTSLINYALKDLKQEEAMDFLVHLTEIVFDEIHKELNVDIPELPDFNELPLS